jgi:putative nucleotidyltransferase with HDIG domain
MLAAVEQVSTRRQTNLLIAAVVGGALVALALGAPAMLDAVTERPGSVLVFTLLVLALQSMSVDVYGRGSIGVSAIGILATGFFLGSGTAAFIAAAAAVAQWVRRRGVLHKAVWDAGDFCVSAAASSLVFHLLDARDASTVQLLGAAILAGAVFTTVNNGLLCLVMSVSERTAFRVVWRERFHWARLHFLAFGPLALAIAHAYDKLGIIAILAFAVPPALLAYSVRQYLDRTRDAVEQVRRANDDLLRSNAELREMGRRIRKTHRDTIAALSRSMEAKDNDTGDHTERVAAIAAALASQLGYTGEELEAIEIGALLHDIGKIAVPEAILLKRGPLDEDEWRVIREHPLVSERILSEIDLHPFVCQIARSSHERYDGLGYPDGLAGEDIPLAARIVLVADAFDAITSDRPYRAGRSASEALFEASRHVGTQFCPQVVAALAQLYRQEHETLETARDPSPHQPEGAYEPASTAAPVAIAAR